MKKNIGCDVFYKLFQRLTSDSQLVHSMLETMDHAEYIPDGKALMDQWVMPQTI